MLTVPALENFQDVNLILMHLRVDVKQVAMEVCAKHVHQGMP